MNLDPSSRYVVRIAEPACGVAPPDTTYDASLLRDVIWVRKASDVTEARRAAFELWDDRYGVTERPEQATVDVSVF